MGGSWYGKCLEHAETTGRRILLPLAGVVGSPAGWGMVPIS